jgi:hypothetical protein
VVLDLERDEEHHDRIPRVGSPRADKVAAHFTFEPIVIWIAHRLVAVALAHCLVAVDRFVIALGRRLKDARVEHTHVAGQTGDDQTCVEGGDGACGD